ncbi:YcjF family protein [Synechococcus sp. PCC 7336]|uniref:YcjF family protein n=1 Tax=Synechococcus sp. PCC 7336 TaxID=195250 RepID=UPI000349E947|nr:GTP-binding protein [Synechococcus sp. PCC 7336]
MSPSLKLAIYLALFGIFVGLLVWLIRTFLDLIYAVRFTPWLTYILVGILAAILLGCLAAAGYFLIVLTRSPQSAQSSPSQKKLPESASEKQAATRDRLAAVQQQLHQIEDEVAREAIAAKAAAIDRNLANQRLKLAIFGTGSAGKTSVLNALLGKTVGTVGAELGTTTASALHRWQLPGIADPIDILDSPGILEIGAAGLDREGEAKAQAAAADLLLFIVDGDLTQSEYEPLMALAELGKRSLLVLNKADRYTESEQAQLLAQLRERVQGTIAFEDVILAAAHPQPIVVAGQSYAVEPKLKELKQRIHQVLLAEGRSLVLDNALLQSEQLSAEARRILGQQMEKEAEKVVERFQWIVTAAVFANPLPVVDLLAAAAINAQMVVEIGGVYGCKLNLARGKELAYSLAKTLAGMGLIEGSIQLMTGVMAAIAEVTPIGFLVTAPIQAASAGYLTRIAGRSFIEYFKRDGSWGAEGIETIVEQQVQRAEREKWLEPFVKDTVRRFLG